MSLKDFHFNNPNDEYNYDSKYDDWFILPNKWGRPNNRSEYGFKEADCDTIYVDNRSWLEKKNIYFFLSPFFHMYEYQFKYTKWIESASMAKENDHIIWEDDETEKCIVARSAMSNFIYYQTEYPRVSANLFTDELAKVTVVTDNMIRASNPYKMLFLISDYLGSTGSSIDSALKGIVGKTSAKNLNAMQSEQAKPVASVGPVVKTFTEDMLYINLKEKNNASDGIMEMYGAELTQSIFKGIKPADDNAKSLFNAFAKPKIAEEEGLALVIKERNVGDAALAKQAGVTAAYEKEQEAIVKWKKKYLVDTGLAKVNGAGKITELVPDANTKISMEALKELANLTGTLVMDPAGLQKMINIPTTQNSNP